MLREKIEELKEIFVTGKEFDEMVKETIYDDYKGEVEVCYELVDSLGNEYRYGNKNIAKNFECDVKKSELDGGYRYTIYLKKNIPDINTSLFEELFEAFWNRKLCDNISGYLATSLSGCDEKSEKTIKKWIEKEKAVAFLMLDLDHFKEVNTKYGHEKGGEVLSEFSHILFNVIAGRGILIHNNGDEFNLLFSYEDYTEVVELVYEVYRAVNGHEFAGVTDVKLTMAVGIWLIDKKEKIDYKRIREKAEEAYDPKGANCVKQRDSIRISRSEGEGLYGNPSIKLSLIRVIGNIYDKKLFNNIYLDYISRMVGQLSDYAELQKIIDGFITWVNPQLGAYIRTTSVKTQWDTKAEFSRSEIGLAVLCGLLKKNVDKIISFKIKQGVLEIAIDNTPVYKLEQIENSEDIEWNNSECKRMEKGVDYRKTVLVQVGYNRALRIPENIFCKVVRVDARPTIGGGLPDFWAATLAALITNMKENDNFSDIVICGDTENASSLTKYLSEIDSWDEKKINYFSKKTYKSYRDIIYFQNKFKERVKILQNENEMIEHVYKVYSTMKNLSHECKKKNDVKNRFMDRNMSYERITLEISDGCRVKSIAQAFPTVLEILRREESRNKKIIDQAGRELIELTDFKILLETPTKEKLPEYYRYDEIQLEQYYEQNFENAEGLFRKRLNKENQIGEMIAHVVSAVKGNEVYATRRAILVVHNEIIESNSYSPLGLVSVWLAPRFYEGRVIVDYSYVWRTVEALVGMPLSMYASVRFSERLTQMINEKIDDDSNMIEIGKVSYIAHSLHMFTDRESMDIVRGIINEVSI